MKHTFQRPRAGHLFVTIGARRWCLGCDLFQQRGGSGFPPPRYDCDWDTPYARAHPELRPPAGTNQERE